MKLNLLFTATFFESNPLTVVGIAFAFFLGVTAVTYVVGYGIIKLLNKNKGKKEAEDIDKNDEENKE